MLLIRYWDTEEKTKSDFEQFEFCRLYFYNVCFWMSFTCFFYLTRKSTIKPPTSPKKRPTLFSTVKSTTSGEPCNRKCQSIFKTCFSKRKQRKNTQGMWVEILWNDTFQNEGELAFAFELSFCFFFLDWFEIKLAFFCLPSLTQELVNSPKNFIFLWFHVCRRNVSLAKLFSV